MVCRSHPMTFGGEELTPARAAGRMDLSNARLSEGAGTRCCILYDPCAYGRLLTKAGLERQRAEQGLPCPRGGEGAAGGHADVLTDYHDSCATLKFLKLT